MIRRKNYSIRSRLLYSFFLTAALMCVMVLYSFISLNSVAISMTDAYRSNVNLKEFHSALTELEGSMEKYISVRTFESIETYFSLRGRLDTLAAAFNSEISADEVLLLEYKLRRIMESFLEYGDKAIYARRANNITQYVSNYSAALRVYGYLSDTIDDLNRLYFDRNIASYGLLFNDMKVVEGLSILILAAMIGINFLMVYILIYKITGPLVDLSHAANEIAAGNFNVQVVDVQGQDEVGTIFRAFDRMTVSIREYVDTIRTKAEIESNLRNKELQIREMYKDAQLKTLQAQINPHFLFNTLNAGAQLAMMEGADNTCTFIEKTADFFRYNIQNMDKATLLSEELTLVDNYMYIMKVRFADRLDYEKRVDCADLNVPMPSMVLQPLVENAIKHGIADMKSGGKITLSVRDDGELLVVTVSDNGKGITEELREKLLHGAYFYQERNNGGPYDPGEISASPAVGIGMINVITRLRVFYNDEDIFDIVSNSPQAGTSFVIRIRHVQDSAR